MAGVSRWVFSGSKLLNTPSRKCGIDADKELSYRQQAANFIQDVGQRLNLRLLAINTAIVYMHRFYMFHSFTKFQRNAIGAACLFLAAKCEEAPRKLEHVLRVYHRLLHRDAPLLDIKSNFQRIAMAAACLFLAAKTEEAPRKLENVILWYHRLLHRDAPLLDIRSNEYLEKAQELVINENILLQTLGFDVCVTHPHSHIVKICDLVRASKDLTQTSYILATNSLHLTMMCVKYKPTVVACVCIHLACKWASVEIPKSSEGKSWWQYADRDVTLEQVEQIAQEFVNILEKFPNRLKRAVQIARGEAPEPPVKQAPRPAPSDSAVKQAPRPAPSDSAVKQAQRPSASATKTMAEREQSRSPAPSSQDAHRTHHHHHQTQNTTHAAPHPDANRGHHHTLTNHDRKHDLKTTHTPGGRTVSPHVSKPMPKSVDSPHKHRSMYDAVDSPNVAGNRHAPPGGHSAKPGASLHGDHRHRPSPLAPSGDRTLPGVTKPDASLHKDNRDIREKHASRERPHEHKSRPSSQIPHTSTVPHHKPETKQGHDSSKHLPFERYKEHRQAEQHKVNPASSHASGGKGRHSSSGAPHPQASQPVDPPHRQLEMSVHNQEHFNRIKKEHSAQDRHSSHQGHRPSSNDRGHASTQHSSQKRTHSPSSSGSRRQSSGSSSQPHASSSKKPRTEPSKPESSTNTHRRTSSSSSGGGKRSHNGNGRRSHSRSEQESTTNRSSGIDELNELNRKLQQLIEQQGMQISSHSSSSSPEGVFQPPLPSRPPLPHEPPPPPPPEDLPPLPRS